MKKILPYLALLALSHLSAMGQTATVTPSATSYSAAGGSITFTVSLTYTAAQSTMGLNVGASPAGWSFGTTAGTNVPEVRPNAGDTGGFGFLYISAPSSPASFTFTVNYPAGLTGNQTFSGIAGLFTPVVGSPQSVPVPNIVISAPPAAPAITTQPISQSVIAGANVSFTVAASGTPTPTYVWKKGAVTLTNTGRFSGADTATLQITGVQTADAGSYTAVASNGVGSPATSNAATLTVAASAQTITFGALATKTYGDIPFALTATASSGLPVSYSSSNSAVATISGSTVSIVGGGTTTITATQAGDANFAAATPVPQTLTVNKAVATVVLGGLTPTYNGSPKAASATTTPPGLTVTFTYDGSATAPTNAGSYAVVGTISSNNYTGSDNGTFIISPASQTITFGALSQKAFNAPPFALTATASSGLPVSYVSSNTAVATVSGSTVTVVGPGTTMITASQAGTSNYSAAADVPQTLTVVQASQTITFAALAAKTYGDVPFNLGGTANSGLTVSYASSNPSVATVSGNTVTVVGAGSTTITARQAGDTNYSAAPDVNQTLTVNKTAASVTLSGLAATYDGTPKPVTATTNPAGLTVNVTYNGSGTVPTGGGNYAIVATIAEANYAGSASGTLVIAKASQTITFGALATATFGDAPIALGATASSGLSVSYASSNPAVATISGSTLTIVGAGSSTITASQAGDNNYSAAAPVPQALTINKAAATVALGSLTPTYDGSAKAATATTTPPGLTVTFTYDGSATAPTNAGSYAVVGTISSSNYAGSSNGTLDIAKANQSIAFGALPQKAFNDPAFALTATATSGLPVSYVSSVPGVATVSGSTVTIVGLGTTTITASQGGNTNYNAAADVGQGLTIVAASQSITFAAISPKTYGTAPFTLGATASSGLTVSYASSNSAVATVSGNTVTIVGAGTSTITASQAGDANFATAPNVNHTVTVNKATASVTLAGLTATYDGTPKPVTATTNPVGLTTTITYNGAGTAPTAGGSYPIVATVVDANYDGSASGTLVIAKASQTVTFATLAVKTYGDAPFAVSATASSNLAVSFTSSNPAVATVSGSTVTIVGGGTTTITANQAGDANYAAAPAVPHVLTVNKAAATVALGGLSPTYDGNPKAATATTTPVGLTVTFTYDGSATAPTNTGSYAVVGTISSNNYTGSASDTLVIGKGSQTITFAALAQKAFNDPAFALTATATSGLAVTYASSNPAVATVSGGMMTIVGVGATTITASQAGNSNYNPATAAVQTLTIVKAEQSVVFAAITPKPFQAGGTFVLGATASSGLPVSYVSSNPTVATVSGSTVTILTPGTTTITANQAGNANYNAAAGVQQALAVIVPSAGITISNFAATYDGSPKPVTVTTNPLGLSVTVTYVGPPNFVATTTPPIQAGSHVVIASIDDPIYKGSAAENLVIAKASQTVTFGSLSAKTFGDVPFTVTATASSTLPVSFASSNPAVATVSGSTVTVVGAGSATITASQAGDVNRSAATPVGQSLTVNKASATVTLSGLTATADGTPKSVTATTFPAGLPVTITYSGSSSAPSAAGSYAVVATVNHNNYAGSAAGTLVIVPSVGTTIAGSYFGTFGGNGGTFALYIRSDRTGVFLGYASGSQIPFVSRDLIVDSNGNFTFSYTVSSPAAAGAAPAVEGLPPVAAANVEYVVRGNVSPNGGVTGTISGLNLTFIAPPAAASGVSQALVGFYPAGASASSSNALTIVGAAGDAYVLTLAGPTADAGKGSINGAGVLSVTTDRNARVAGSVDGRTAAITMSIAASNGGAVNFAGANNEARTDYEKLINISTRSQAGTPANTLIAGFVITGTAPKPVLVRAVGPTLGTAFNVSGALIAARLEIFGGQTSLAVGNDWGAASNASEIAATSARVGAFALPATSRDAALLLTLAPGAYTAVVTGQGTASGISLVEVYDATVGAIPKSERIINIATRATAGAGDNALIAGFYINGTVPKRVLIRGIGPSLAQFGVADVLARPQLTVNSGATVLMQNAGWSTSPDAAAIATASAQVGAFALPAGSQDAALIINLSPGAYTAGVTGVAGTTGVALVEVYEVP